VPSQNGGTASVAPPGQQYFGSGSCGGGPDGEFWVFVPLTVPPVIVVPALALPLMVELLLSVIEDVDDVPSPITWMPELRSTAFLAHTLALTTPWPIVALPCAYTLPPMTVLL